jgi:protein SCO1/2
MLGVALAAPSMAQPAIPSDQTPAEFEGAGVEEKLDAQVPLDLAFVDEQGEAVTLRRYFDSGKPVILSLNYFRCPMLCTLTLNGLVDAARRIDWTAGDEFQILTVSFNPDEGPELAEVKKRGYLQSYGREDAADGWHFLTGSKDNIDRLCDAVGFGYRYDEKTGEYAHSSSIIFLTPEGRVSRYMHDVQFNPNDVRLSLVEASQGTIGSPSDKILLFTCFQWDPESGSYAPSAMKIMRAGAMLTLLVVVVVLLVLWLRGPRHHDAEAKEERSAQLT